MSDDAGTDAGFAVAAAGAHRRDAVGELDLADRAHLRRPVGAIHRQPFQIHGRGDVVAAGGDVGQQVGQQVAPAFRPVDQVMVRIDDRQVGLEGRLAPLVEPLRPDRQVRADRGWLCHRLLPVLKPTSP